MVPYYVMPAVCLAILVSFHASRRRHVGSSAAGLALTVMTFYHMGEWAYFGEMTALFVFVLAASRPGRQDVRTPIELEPIQLPSELAALGQG